uniref:Glutathione S-transferase omega-1 n=1 Tax=Phallusia mammillata TaxID=59560 RepID=A0A6F9DET3_9ASCI|nr:glutathione S-transferase omega-1 [Phallusia mammillata]
MESTDSSIVFYNRHWSPMSQAVKLVLTATNLPHKTVDLATNDASANALPTLARNGTSAIANYKDAIEFLNSVNGRTIVPEKSEDRTKQFKLLEHFVLHIVPFFERAVILTSPREGFDLLLESMSFLENHLTTSSGRFFGGEQPNFVDYGIYPYLDKVLH